jgi:asparagine synthetase B (glutamine-hydrolysing)
MIGAWGAAPGEEAIRAMRAQLGPGDYAEARQGALWLLARRDKLFPGGAYEGFIPEGESPGQAAVEDWRQAPEGHFVLASARPGRLSLLRALSGGERLFHARVDGTLLFSSSLRPLLAHPRIARRLNAAKLREAMLTGLTLSGEETLIDGISEVAPGHVLHLSGDAIAHRWHYEGLLQPLQGSPQRLAARYRDALARAVAISAGPSRPVAVTLSGGIDSAAIAALAVEAFGAGAVTAFTYEFDDPRHRPSETPYAAEVCRRLGIRDHRVFRIGFDQFLAAIPETVWRAESFVHWPKAFLLVASKRIREAGFERYLCGFGVGSHMGYYEEIARLLRWLPAPLLALYWNLAQGRGGWLERLHPALAVPNQRVRHFLLNLLGGGVDEAFRGMPTAELLRHQSFSHLVSCIDVTRWEKPLRELGVHRVSPAHFASTIPYAYLNYRPAAAPWSEARQLRPGKHLLRLAMRDVLPESVLYRRKSWADAVVSRAWLSAGARWMRSAVPEYWRIAGPEARASALRRWDARSPQHAVTALAFWSRIFVDRPPSARPPRWEELAA